MKTNLLPLLLVAATALENFKITPHTLLSLAIDGDAEPMVLASTTWQDYAEVPCQYFFKEGFYNLFNPFDTAYFISNASPAT